MENTSQMLNLTPAEMLIMWKTVLNLDTPRRECAVEWDDGIDLDAALTVRISQWYAHILATAPAHLLPVEDVKADVEIVANGPGPVAATVPDRCVRPVEWKLREWKRSVTTFLDPCSHEAMVQLSPWTRGSVENPAAIDYGFQLLLLSSPSGEPQLERARCVVRPADGNFRFHADLIVTIPAFDTQIM